MNLRPSACAPGNAANASPGCDLPAVGGDAPRSRTEPRQQRGDVVLGDRQRGHQVSSSIAEPGGGRITLSTGASFGTASMRSEAPMTAENTGAATSPP